MCLFLFHISINFCANELTANESIRTGAVNTILRTPTHHFSFVFGLHNTYKHLNERLFIPKGIYAGIDNVRFPDGALTFHQIKLFSSASVRFTRVWELQKTKITIKDQINKSFTTDFAHLYYTVAFNVWYNNKNWRLLIQPGPYCKEIVSDGIHMQK